VSIQTEELRPSATLLPRFRNRSVATRLEVDGTAAWISWNGMTLPNTLAFAGMGFHPPIDDGTNSFERKL
jgi:hypothetical protein